MSQRSAGSFGSDTDNKFTSAPVRQEVPREISLPTREQKMKHIRSVRSGKQAGKKVFNSDYGLLPELSDKPSGNEEEKFSVESPVRFRSLLV